MDVSNLAELDAALHAILSGAVASTLETATLDFKEPRPSRADTERMVVEAMVCFANSRGGILVLGVRDKVGGPEAFVGAGRLDPDELQHRVHLLTQPPLTVDVRRHPEHPTLLLVSTTKSREVHSDSQGRAYRRVDTECHPMGPQELATLYEERRGVDPLSEPGGRSVSDVSPLAIETARKMLALYADHRRALSTLSATDMLAAIGALSARDELNRAGTLLFCEPAPRAPKVDYIVYQYKDTPGGESRSVTRLEAPLLLAFEKAMSLIQGRSSSQRITLPNGQQIAIEDFPLVAVRESLSNALCHRDYRTTEPVTIEHSPTVLGISSPGSLLPGVTLQNIITTPSRTRNPVLLRIVRNLGIAEELGSGIDRMVRAMVGAGRQLPEINADAMKVRVSLVGGAANTNLVRFVAQLPEAERDDTDTMLILAWLCSKKTVSASILAPVIQKSEVEALSVLRRIAADDVELLEPTQHSRNSASPTYRLRNAVLAQLGSAVAYSRKTIDDTDRKIIAHLREYRQITNKTVQNLFDVDVFRARNILASLNQRAIIARISEAARGPNVVWGPGPKFPTARARKRSGASGKKS
jgi:ATP-dependent DNA helicase RecG